MALSYPERPVSPLNLKLSHSVVTGYPAKLACDSVLPRTVACLWGFGVVDTVRESVKKEMWVRMWINRSNAGILGGFR